MTPYEHYKTHRDSLEALRLRQHELVDLIRAGNTEHQEEFDRALETAKTDAIFMAAFGVQHLIESEPNIVELKETQNSDMMERLRKWKATRP